MHSHPWLIRDTPTNRQINVNNEKENWTRLLLPASPTHHKPAVVVETDSIRVLSSSSHEKRMTMKRSVEVSRKASLHKRDSSLSSLGSSSLESFPSSPQRRRLYAPEHHHRPEQQPQQQPPPPQPQPHHPGLMILARSSPEIQAMLRRQSSNASSTTTVSSTTTSASLMSFHQHLLPPQAPPSRLDSSRSYLSAPELPVAGRSIDDEDHRIPMEDLSESVRLSLNRISLFSAMLPEESASTSTSSTSSRKENVPPKRPGQSVAARQRPRPGSMHRRVSFDMLPSPSEIINVNSDSTAAAAASDVGTSSTLQRPRHSGRRPSHRRNRVHIVLPNLHQDHVY